MDTGIKINNIEIADIYESFPNEIANTYGVTSSKLTSDSAIIKKGSQPLKSTLGKTFPTSAGNSAGGQNSTSKLKFSGENLNVALKGCRPIGIPIAQLTTAGTHYINRINNQTWLSSSANSASGTLLEYNPKFVHIELVGGGGGGAGSSVVYASAGGGGGGYCYSTVEIPDNSYIKLVVGDKGAGGSSSNNGNNGGKSSVYLADNTELCSASGGYGGGTDESNGGNGGTSSGGITNITGGQGGKKEQNGHGIESVSVHLNKPENSTWQRGGKSGGSSSGNHYGGGGGASAFSNGATANSYTTPSDAQAGAGGAGAGYKFANSSRGGHGGVGLINIYY